MTDAGADIEKVIEEVRRRVPGVRCDQLQVTQAADDDGIWFFDLPETGREVQVESWNGMCPFLVEGNATQDKVDCESVMRTVEVVVSRLTR
jgi:hypothetical protein